MLLKVLFILLLLLLVFLWWKHKLIERLKRDMADSMTRQTYRPGSLQTHEEKMVRCVRCDMFVPMSEAILHDGKFYCSDEHAKASR